jgi:hypothetical protein
MDQKIEQEKELITAPKSDATSTTPQGAAHDKTPQEKEPMTEAAPKSTDISGATPQVATHEKPSQHYVVMAAVVSAIGVAIAVSGVDTLILELARCGTATFTKLAGSMDDVVWLTPFMIGSVHKKGKHGMVYCVLFAIEVCLCTGATEIFAFLIGKLLPQSVVAAGWDVPHVMQVSGGGLLAFYGCKLFADWRAGSGEDDEEEKPAGDLGVYELVTIGVLGSMDDMCLQASTLASGAFAFRHMMVGVLLGCSIVVGICWGASQLESVMKLAAAVPMWCVVGCLATATLGGAFFG